MNRTALSVIGLAVGAVLIIGLFNIYKPAVSHVAHDVFSKVHVNHLGLKEHKWGNVYYTDDHHGNIEFTRGKLSSKEWSNYYWGHTNFVNGNVPTDIKNATSIKFDNVDTSQVTTTNCMFWNDKNIKSIDFGDNFDTSHIDMSKHLWTEVGSMFQSDPNLEHINFGRKATFNGAINDNEFCNMFYGDHKLQQPTGNFNQHVQNVYNHNIMPNDKGYPCPAY